MKHHYIILLWLILSSGVRLQAQNELMLQDTVTDPQYYEQRGDWFKVRTIGLSASTMRDQALSPLLYFGGGISQSLVNNYKFKPRTFVHAQSQFNLLVYLNPQADNDSQIQQTGFEYQRALHYPIALSNDDIKLYVGGFAGGLFNVRIHSGNVNNILSYELAAQLGPAGMVQFPLTVFGKQFVVSDELRFPLVSLLANTPYAWPLPTAFEEGGRVGDALTVGLWNKLFRLSNQVNVDFHRNKRRRGRVIKRQAYRVGYRWEFVSVAQPNLYQAGTHTLSFARIIAY